MADIWRVAPEWNGESCFIVAGGPSVAALDLDGLAGRRVIAINSSWQRVPWAPLLFFGDARWWHHYRDEVLTSYHGRIATTARGIEHPRVMRLHPHAQPGLAAEPDTLAIQRTSTRAAINLAVHLGVDRIVLLGVDNQIDANGRTHHHAAHPWDLRTSCFDEQRADLASLVTPLHHLGIEIINASPESALPFWPKQSLSEIYETGAFAQRHAGVGRQPPSAGAGAEFSSGIRRLA
jgi:hypothetical protein